MRIIAIGADPVDKSRELARSEHIRFPLIEDRELKIAKQFVGVDKSDYPLPGVVVLLPGRQIYFRQIGDTPATRIFAPELLNIIDSALESMKKLSSSPPSEIRGGYTMTDRMQFRIGGNVGAAQERSADGDLGFAAGLELGLFYPLHRNIMIGSLIRGHALEGERLDLDAVLRLRTPLLGGVAEGYLQIPLGTSLRIHDAAEDTVDRIGWTGAAQLGLQVAPRPTFSVFAEAGLSYHSFGSRGGDDDLAEARYTFGLGVAWHR